MGSPGFAVPHRGWILRGLVFLLGAVLVGVAAFAVFEVSPSDLNPEPGSQARVTENVDYWTPGTGDQQALRPRTAGIQGQEGQLAFVEEISGVHSPRGDRFELPLGDRLELESEPGARASFPPTPLWTEPPESVYLGVPWRTDEGIQIGAFDRFHRLGETERGGITLVEYKAREPNQFFVTDDKIWFRAAERTALVDGVTGTVVDYRDHEVLWTATSDRPDLLNQLDPPRSNREKVWEATIEPTPASEDRLLEIAKERRTEALERRLWTGGPPLAGAWVLMAAALVGRPRRFLQPDA